MRVILSEYGIAVIAIIGAILAIVFVTQFFGSWKTFSWKFIGCLTGNYHEYSEYYSEDGDITLESLESMGGIK